MGSSTTDEPKVYKYQAPNGNMVSRQRMWQLRKIAEGKCRICGKDAVTKMVCEEHRKVKG